MRSMGWTWPASWVLALLMFLTVSCSPADPAKETIANPPPPARSAAAAGATNAVGAPIAPAVITPAAARQHKGERVTVRGKVADVHVTQKGDVFLNFGGKYPQAVFSAVCFQGAIPAAQLTPLNGKTISVTGRIREYNGQVEIVLETQDQIEK